MSGGGACGGGGTRPPALTDGAGLIYEPAAAPLDHGSQDALARLDRILAQGPHAAVCPDADCVVENGGKECSSGEGCVIEYGGRMCDRKWR